MGRSRSFGTLISVGRSWPLGTRKSFLWFLIVLVGCSLVRIYLYVMVDHTEVYLAKLLALGDVYEKYDQNHMEYLEPYPEEIFQVNWENQVDVKDLIHVSVLHRACITHNQSVIPWEYGIEADKNNNVLINETDPNVLEKLRICPDVDIFIPEGIRSHGYCEDAVAYTKCEYIYDVGSKNLTYFSFRSEIQNASILGSIQNLL